ncbi:MAG: glycerol-3-phosphate acyltransferase [Dehalococcoidales bacterium]|nr:glycerol-3-phosphate acyltransferase [Dehalococcoidales bacterium]MDZ4231162.1 glycerol-3-phosphate acyltransferase [Dehalococcoidales bacterium]
MTAVGIPAIAIAYLLGSIPFAYIVTRLLEGADIRQLGDGNPGTANVMREVGIIPDLAVLLLDLGKGLLAVLVARWLGTDQIIVLICGIAAVAGHMWSLFLGLRGGGGAATTLGVFFALVPVEFSISFFIMAVTALLTRNFGFSVGVGLLPLPLILWAFGVDASLIIYSLVLTLLLTLRNGRDWPALLRKLAISAEWKEVIFKRKLRLRKKE